jgi:hypothetical protein
LGIRASLSYKSLRTSVCDKRAFYDRIGFSHVGKSALKDLVFAYGDGVKSSKIPPDIAIQAANEITASDSFREYPNARQSAIYRMRVGSSSYAQAEKQLRAAVPESELLDNEFQYEFQVITEIERTDEMVDMFDIEVFDNDHAFSANGVIVHNSSADITKIAMVFVYRLIKQKGWQDKVRMLMTIHDELVFEIDHDVLEEAIDDIVDAMTRNPLVLKHLQWSIPLTSDVELGNDWSLPYNLMAMRKGEKKWPEALAPLFTQHKMPYWTAPAEGGELKFFHLEDLKESLQKRADETKAVVAEFADMKTEPPIVMVNQPTNHQEPAEAPETPVGEGGSRYLMTGGLFATIRIPRLDLGFLNDLAFVLHKANESGTTPVRFVLDSGEDVTSEFMRHYRQGIHVDVDVLRALMKTRDFV